MEERSSLTEHSETSLSRLQHENSPESRHDQYTVAWICALYIEMAAARAMLDQIHEPPLTRHADDTNAYVLGRIKQHNVVIACLPDGQYGTNNAAIVLTNMNRTFKAIRACLMVGIGGGVPRKFDIRLGDIVVGTRVMQCDLGKVVGNGELQRTAVPRMIHPLFGTALTSLRSKHELGPSRVSSILQQKLKDQPAYNRPILPDHLFYATYDHVSAAPSCDECDQSKLVPRSNRMPDDIRIHYGAIASGNQVMRSGMARDDIARQLDIICFEMESSGIIDILPCLPIRGICDYSDSHKNKEWQRYAAATAAAYARELLEELPVTETHTRDVSVHTSHQSSSLKRRQKLLDSLQFKHSDSRRMNINVALDKTCTWFPSHPYYKAWLDPAQLTKYHGFLWISGKPGAGKSTIMKFAYSGMKQNDRRRHALTASFFFNARGAYLEKSVLGMYRSLLLQLLEGYTDLQKVLDDPDLIPPGLDDCPPLNVLKDLFRNSVSALGQRKFTCFVDALDECDEQQVVDMVYYFEDLTEHISAKGIPFRMCFSSRHYPYIVIRRGLRLTLEEQSGHAEDLATYVASRLRIDDPTLAEELRSQLLGKAAGVFMWVVLVVDILNKENRRGGMSLRERLAEIPSDLSALFKDILRRDSENPEALLLCLIWILYAKRPLHPTEFYHALWSGLSLDNVVHGQIPDVTVAESPGLSRFEKFVISSSKGLAEVTKSRHPTVQFIHESIRDFLVKDRGLQELWPEVGFDCESPAHEKLKQCCNLYLNHSSVDASVSKLQSDPTRNEWKEFPKSFPFLKYATQHILYHADSAAKMVPQDTFLTSFPLAKWIWISNVFRNEYTPNASLIYLLAKGGFSALIRTRLREDVQVHVRGESYGYPLFAALAHAHKDAFVALLKLPSSTSDGIDITKGLQFRDYKSRTPLSWAAQEGHDHIMEILLQNGVDVNEVDEDGRTPLARASDNGHEGPVKLLIQKNALVDKGGNDNTTPLLLASNKGHRAVMIFLIEKGANVNKHNRAGQTPLHHASQHGNATIAGFLIDKGVLVNTRDNYGWTPLSLASRNGHEAVVRLLIRNGAEVNHVDEGGWTALSHALYKRHGGVVRLLIENGAIPDARTASVRP